MRQLAAHSYGLCLICLASPSPPHKVGCYVVCTLPDLSGECTFALSACSYEAFCRGEAGGALIGASDLWERWLALESTAFGPAFAPPHSPFGRRCMQIAHAAAAHL